MIKNGLLVVVIAVQLALGLVVFSGCKSTGSAAGPSSSEPASSDSNEARADEPMKRGDAAVDHQLVPAYNQFGFNLFGRIAANDQGKNLFISPYSVATALAMTYNGAAGETQQAMATALGIAGIGLPDLNTRNAELRKGLTTPESKVEISVANSLWARQGVEFKKDFLDRNAQFYGAQISSLNFADPSAAATINRWVDSATKNKISKIVDQLDAQTVMLLINAVYFKGKWKVEFEKSQTEPGDFHLAGGKQKKVPLMFQSGKYPYLKGDGFEAMALSYGEGRLKLYVFLPDEKIGLPGFLKKLNRTEWDSWMSRFRDTEGDLRLPRFKVEYQRDLNDVLKALGMEAAFDAGRANFSGMRAQRDLFIQNVKHKSFVEVNEEGTEAAASTSVAIGITSVVSRRFSMIINRPFYMAIRDDKTGLLLFSGAIFEP